MNRLRCIVASAFLVLLTVGSVSACQIAFRVDDVQEWWIAEAQRELISRFASRRIPVTLGVIAGGIDRGDIAHASFLRQVVLDRSLVEVACHGVEHVPFVRNTLVQQTEDLRECAAKLKAYLPSISDVATFLPPENAWNSDTVAALQTAGYSLLSALEDCPVASVGGIAKFPTAASTSYTGGEVGFHDGCSASVTMEQIQAQVASCGFSVVMLHPQEFAASDAGGLNHTQLAELDALLDAVAAAGCSAKLMRDLAPAAAAPAHGSLAPPTESPSAPSGTEASPTSYDANPYSNAFDLGVVFPEEVTVTSSPGASAAGVGCKIGFRIDDIQEFWLTEAQQTVLEMFSSRNVPLTIGVIASEVGIGDEAHASFLRRYVQGNRVEVACHGVQHVPFTRSSLEKQTKDLADCNTQLRSYLPSIHAVSTFIPPENAFNQDTLAAMRTSGYGVLSALDSCPTAAATGVRRFPTASGTSFTGGAVGFGDGCPASVTMEQIQAQVASCGFSVVMLHPQEFAASDAGGLNHTQFAELDAVLESVGSLGCTMALLRDM